MNGNAIRETLKKRGMTHREFAEELGCNLSFVDKMLSGAEEPRMWMLKRMCSVLKVDPRKIW